ncbi:uncharacterized protein LOC110859455 [Folsomia candida]|uniref:Uncharacterized protein n=1 Tax=Folsomia candida TaxID=158441 RepID=A0A226DAN4_FOLCA|nr:uncharacterized protein LOC110859455 [Folsomia candida]OXA42269.1 hypothetical protein Fcan01_22976 [Folsomia candida]
MNSKNITSHVQIVLTFCLLGTLIGIGHALPVETDNDADLVKHPSKSNPPPQFLTPNKRKSRQSFPFIIYGGCNPPRRNWFGYQGSYPTAGSYYGQGNYGGWGNGGNRVSTIPDSIVFVETPPPVW